MRIKSAITAFTILISTAVSTPVEAQNGSQTGTSNAVGQNNGFRIGPSAIQNPAGTPLSPTPVQGISNPIQGTASPIQGMTSPPILPLGGGIAQQQNPVTAPRVQGGATVLVPGATVFVPPGTLVIENNDPFIPGSILSAPDQPNSQTQTATRPSNTSNNGGRSNSQNSQGQRGRTANQTATTAKSESSATTSTGVDLGTPRDKVIEKFGNPVAFMMGMNGETLYFDNGVVVFVKDGVVAAPGK